MSQSHRLRLHEIRQVHELVGRILRVGHRPDAWRTIALDGLRQLVGGNVGLTCDTRLSPDGVPGFVDPLDTGWQTESVRRRFVEYATGGEMASDPGVRALLAGLAVRRALHATRRELVNDAEWYASPCVSEARRMGDVNDFVVGGLAVGPGAIHGFVVYRAWRDPPFETRHRRLMRLFHLELARAARSRAEADGPQLSPRLKQTLDLMLTSMSLKQVAQRLGLSRHTVNDYQKALYARFGVNSRLELIEACRGMGTAVRLPADLRGPAVSRPA